jgi:hypothetical protein
MKRTTTLGGLIAAIGLAAVSLLPVAPAAAAGTENGAYGMLVAGNPDAPTFFRAVTKAAVPLVVGTGGTASDASETAFVDSGGRLATASLLTATVTPTSAAATAESVGLLRLTFGPSTPLVFVGAVETTCLFDAATGTVSGAVAIEGGVVSGGTALPAAPGANTAVATGGTETLVLNRQRTAPDGSLIVDGIVYTDESGNVVVLASATCQPADLLAVDAVAPVVALGAAGLAALGGAAWYGRLRRRPSSVAHPALAD